MKRFVFLKILAVFFVLAIGYHFSGVETVFCKDDIQTSALSHDCSVCQHVEHIAALKSTVHLSSGMPALTGFIPDVFSHSQEFTVDLFRPPILA